MALIVPNKLIYLAHPRTASKATCVTLGQIDSAFTEPVHHRRLFDLEYEREGELVVTTVRHHADALVSWWKNHGQKNHGYGEDLDEFTRFLREFPDSEIWIKPSTNRLWDLHTPWCNAVMRYEDVQTELDWVLEKVGLLPMQLLRVNQTRGKDDWRNYYNAERERIVADVYGDEMREFGYSFD
tara:strand:+ start:3106 stop:3654 length:549 start_codon:yes stop_codon:yes gene_type:complete